jgi:hypothetical protein
MSNNIKILANSLHQKLIKAMEEENLKSDTFVLGSDQQRKAAKDASHIFNMWKFYNDHNKDNNNYLDSVLDKIEADIKEMRTEVERMLAEICMPEWYMTQQKPENTEQTNDDQAEDHDDQDQDADESVSGSESGSTATDQQPDETESMSDWLSLTKEAVSDKAFRVLIVLGPVAKITAADRPKFVRLFILCSVNKPIGINKPEMQVVKAYGFNGRSWEQFCLNLLNEPGVRDLLIKEFPKSAMLTSFGDLWPLCKDKLHAAIEVNDRKRRDDLDLRLKEMNLNK